MRRWIVVLVVSAACSKPNPNRCCIDESDCEANHIPVGSTCADGLVCVGNQCVADTCTMSSECDSTSPYCVSGLCASACTDDTQCPGATQDATQTFCEGGACVACRQGMMDCPADAPVCDMGTCRACVADDDCASTVCDVDSGMCVDPSDIRYAAADGVDTNDCSQAAPCTVTKAVSIVDAQRSWVRMEPGSYTVAAGLVLTNVTVNIIGTGASLDGFVSVDANANVVIRGLQMTASPPWSCAPATGTSVLTIRQSTGTTACADLLLTHCALTLDRSSFACSLDVEPNSFATIDRSSLLGLSVHDSVQITNSVMAGTVTLALGANSPAVIYVAYSTFNLPDSSYQSCNNQPAQVTFVNDIFYGSNVTDSIFPQFAADCTFQNNIAYPQTTIVGTGTIMMDPKLSDPANGDDHLTLGSPAIDAAASIANEPTVDYDGVTRPQGARRDIGAFEYKP